MESLGCLTVPTTRNESTVSRENLHVTGGLSPSLHGPPSLHHPLWTVLPEHRCSSCLPLSVFVVYYESLKREIKTKTIYGFRCDERLKTKVEESTLLGYTLLCVELEHLKIETRLINETLVSEMGEYASVM